MIVCLVDILKNNFKMEPNLKVCAKTALSLKDSYSFLMALSMMVSSS